MMEDIKQFIQSCKAMGGTASKEGDTLVCRVPIGERIEKELSEVIGSE